MRYYKGDIVELLQPIYHPSGQKPEFEVGSRLKVRQDQYPNSDYIKLDISGENAYWHDRKTRFVFLYKRPFNT